MRKIYDYKDLRQLEKSTIYNRITEGVVITATADLATEIGAYYPASAGNKGITTIDVHQVIASVIDIWDEKVKDVRNYIGLRNIIEDYIGKNNLSETNRAYLRRNAVDIWNAIILLVEADVFPDDIPENVSPTIQEFKKLWKQIEIENQSFMEFRSTFLFSLSNRAYLEERIPTFMKGKEIFLLGFYYITPIQQRILESLERAGYIINYLNNYNSKHPLAFEIWRETYKAEYDLGVSIDIQPDIEISNWFSACIDDGYIKIDQLKKVLKIYSFNSDFDFATHCFHASKSGGMMYTTDTKRTEKLLREFFPDEYQDKHLLSYPVGQYIYNLHMMWNEFTEQLELKFDYVIKCFASGWLEVDGITGKDYLYELKNLEIYYNGCITFDEWRERTTSLLEAKSITSVFNNDKSQSKWADLLGNPFNKMMMYQIENDSIEAIVKLLRKLMSDAEFLFAGDTKKNLYLHMKKIKDIIETRPDNIDITNEEKQLTQELISRLSGPQASGIVCHINSIKDAIILLIGDHRDEEETYENETSNKKRMIKPVSLIEASVLSNFGQDIHLVMADEFLLPGKPRKLPWPLTHELICGLISSLEIQRKDSADYVKSMNNLITTRAIANRYLFFSLFENITNNNKPSIHLNWISKQGDKDVAPSSYLSLFGLKLIETEKNEELLLPDVLREKILSGKEQKRNHEIDDIILPNDNLPEEVVMDFALCKMRYIYSYVFNEYPGFSSEFHYSFVLSNLIGAFTVVSGEKKKIIADNIFELFPFLRNIQQSQAYDFAHNMKTSDFEFKGVTYPGSRLNVHYLVSSVKKRAEENAKRIYERESFKWVIEEENCMYCPYSSICRVRYEERANG